MNDKTKKPEPQGPFWLVHTTGKARRRRAGLSFGPEGRKLDISALSEAQRKAIQDDPMLKVSEEKGGV